MVQGPYKGAFAVADFAGDHSAIAQTRSDLHTGDVNLTIDLSQNVNFQNAGGDLTSESYGTSLLCRDQNVVRR